METPVTSLRERKKTRTRELLVEVATELFLEQGFDATTVDQIAARAAISPRTYFRYFPTKESVVFQGHGKRISRFRDLLAEHRKAGTPVETVWRALDELTRDFVQDREQFLTEYRIVTASPLLIARDVELDLEFEAAIAETLAGSPRARPAAQRRARINAGAIFGAIRAVMQEWYSNGCRIDLAALGREARQILEAGSGKRG